MKIKKTATSKKKLISRQTANKVRFLLYASFFMLLMVQMVVIPKIDEGVLGSVGEMIVKILLAIFSVMGIIIALLDFYLEHSRKVEKKDELYEQNEALANSLTLRFTMIALLTAGICLDNDILINWETIFLIYSIIGMVFSLSMVLLEYTGKMSDFDDEDEE